MVKNNKKKGKKSKKRVNIEKKKKASFPTTSKRVVKKPPEKIDKANIKEIPVSEKREVWKKNFILVGIVVVLIVLNLLPYLLKKKTGDNLNNVPSALEGQNQIESRSTETGPIEDREKAAESNEEAQPVTEEEIKNWKAYRNATYSFDLKYPGSWPEPEIIKPSESSKYIFKVSFRDNSEQGYKQIKGFDVAVYRSKSNTETGIFTSAYSDNLFVKDTAAADYSNCNELEVEYVGKNKYPAVKVIALPEDPCFSEAYFFSLRRGNYVYDIVPSPEGGKGYIGYNGEKEVKSSFPDFYGILTTLNFSIARKIVNNPVNTPKNESPKSKVVTSKPRGIRCPEKIQHPKSSPNKGKHVDEACCPDPDEWPKAGCAYSAHDYSIMLKGKPK